MSKRKAYRGKKKVRLDTMRTAVNRCAALTVAERAIVLDQTGPAFDCMRAGKAKRQDWAYLADAANVGEALCDLGICSDKESRRLMMAMQLALKAIAERVNARGIWTATGPELNAVREGLDRHEIQLTYCSLQELQQAIQAVERNVRAAREGRMTTVTILEAA